MTPRAYLVQLLLPLDDYSGTPFPESHYEELRAELTAHFGGLTVYSRSPAERLWKEGGRSSQRDDITVDEVMTETLDRAWWAECRARLERRFAQDELVVRAQQVERV